MFINQKDYSISDSTKKNFHIKYFGNVLFVYKIQQFRNYKGSLFINEYEKLNHRVT